MESGPVSCVLYFIIVLQELKGKTGFNERRRKYIFLPYTTRLLPPVDPSVLNGSRTVCYPRVQ